MPDPGSCPGQAVIRHPEGGGAGRQIRRQWKCRITLGGEFVRGVERIFVLEGFPLSWRICGDSMVGVVAEFCHYESRVVGQLNSVSRPPGLNYPTRDDGRRTD